MKTIGQSVQSFIEPRILKIILVWYLVTRACLLIIGGTSYILYSNSSSFTGFFVDKNLQENSFVMSPFVRCWASWDSIYFYRIAEEGYPDITDKDETLKTTRRFAFFPLYPFLIRILSTVSGLNLYLSGLLISNVFFVAGCVLLYKLFSLDYSKQTALLAVKFMIVAPTSFVFSGYFTESLYLFLLLLSFWMARQKNWLLSGVAGMLSAMTRVPGVLSIVPLGMIAWRQARNEGESPTRKILQVLPLLLLPVGLGIFMLINYRQTGDPLFFFNVQETWGRQVRNPLISLPLELVNSIRTAKINRFLETGATLTAFALVASGFRWLLPEYLVLCLYSLVVPLLSSTWSMPRYLLPIFPLYLCLTRLGTNRRTRDLTIVFLAMMMGFLMVNWSIGGKLVI